MAITEETIEPTLSRLEREELSHLDDFHRRIKALGDRGLIAPEALDTILSEGKASRETILRRGRVRAMLRIARNFAEGKRPAEAREWVARARDISPEDREAWELEISLCWEVGHHGEAIALCAEAADRFPEMRRRHDELCRERTAQEMERAKAEQAREELRVHFLIERMKRARKESRDTEAITLAREILDVRPDEIEALATAAHSLQRQAQLQEALGLYEHLVSVDPGNEMWTRRVGEIRDRLGGAKPIGATAVWSFARRAGQPSSQLATGEIGEAPPISWSSIAGEFLQEHWQKLILCLAVLLIVVSSTVGAHLLLGDRLWSPLGKCSMAMVATLMFAALGMGLVRWGAERAGRMMLVTTLIVVPIHFMLAGELRIVLEPSPSRLVGFAVLTASLVAVARLVGGMLLPSKDAWFLTVPLILMSVFNASMARGVSGPWARQFAAFQAPAIVVLAAVWGLRARKWEASAERNRDFGDLFLGLLGFALVTSLIRTGVYALELPATLFAVPVMLTAIASVHGARWLSAFEPDPREIALMRLGGYALAGLALAMALARPIAPSPLYIDNTLAAAVLGIWLFAGSLRLERHPAFLYLGFGAFVITYFALRQALGLEPRFHGPFRAINGLLFNAILAALALAFSEQWKDERLHLHCHYLGVPLSIAACVYSGFDPRAAFICMEGYFVLYLLGTWVFRAPWVQYLAIAAFSGAAYFGSTLLPGIAFAEQALGAGAIGLGCVGTALLMRRLGVDVTYRAAWLLGGLFLTALAMAGATGAMAWAGTVSYIAAATFVVVSIAAALANLERPEDALGYVSVVCADLAAGLGLVAADLSWRRGLGIDRYAIAAGACGLLQAGLGAWLGRRSIEPGHAQPVRSFVGPFRHVGLIVASLAVVLCVIPLMDAAVTWSPVRSVNLAIALASSASAFAIGSAVLGGVEALAYVAVWAAVGGYFLGVLGGLQLARVPRVAATMQVALAAASLLLYAAWHRLRVPYHRRPLLLTAIGLAGVVVPVALATWHPGTHIALALALAGLSVVGVAGEFLFPPLVPSALLAFLGVWLKGFEAAGITMPSGTLFFATALATYDLVLLGAAEWLQARPVGTLTDQGRRQALFGSWIIPFVIVASFVVDALACMNPWDSWRPGLILLLGASALLGSSRFLCESSLVYFGLVNLAFGVMEFVGWAFAGADAGLLHGWRAIALAVLALGLWLAGVVGRRCRVAETYWTPCLNTALAFTTGVFLLALVARVDSRGAFALAASALAIDAILILLIGAAREWAVLTYPAVASIVTASYVVLLSVGRSDPAMAYVLGLNAVIQALFLWLIGEICRRSRGDWTRACAIPLFHSAAVLTWLAIAPAYASPVTMVLVAVSFLLAIKGLPSALWLYPAVGAFGLALYMPWLSHVPLPGQIAACIAGAYALWTVGMILRRYGGRLCERLSLEALDYAAPPFNLAAGLGATAFVLKFDRVPERGLDLTARPWVPLSLAPLSLGLLRAYPRRELVHVSLLLLAWGLVSVIAPSLASPGFLALALLVASAGFQAVEPAIRRDEGPIGRLAGAGHSGIVSIVRAWALSLWFLGGVIVCVLALSLMAEALLGTHIEGLAIAPLEWWAVLAALVVAGLGLGLMPLDPVLIGWTGPEGLVVAAELLGVIVLWWLGVADSPLGRWLPRAGDFYPLVTALATLGIAEQNRRLSPPREGGGPASGLARLTSPLVLVLALVASGMTLGRENSTTAAALALVAAASMIWAIGQDEPRTAILGGLAWLGAGAVAGLVLAGRFETGTTGSREIGASVGILAAIYTLWGLAGRLRGSTSPKDARENGTLAGPLECIGFVGALATAGLVALAAGQGAATAWITYAGVVSLLGVALFFVLLVPRWRVEWLVYLAQAAMLGAYVDLRMAHALPATGDAAVLTLFAFIDMGIAEVLERLHLPIYARPTRFTSLVVPILPLVQLIGIRGVGEVTVFHLVSAATFYAVACGTLGWKNLAYAAGVLYNAALWVLWGQMGWQLADHPQFYLVPVGLSAILFAEANRRELGREIVNTIRTAGLIVTYLAMAAPIWQYRSFGDWVALLIGSLVGLFVGIGLRVQTFVWLGLVTFLADVLYELGRVSLDHALAKWAIMLTLGISLVFFVALNEKKQIVTTMRGYLAEVRTWE